jgi:hypothetical protein
MANATGSNLHPHPKSAVNPVSELEKNDRPKKQGGVLITLIKT